MYGNGARIGMEITAAVHRRTQQDHHRALTVFSVAVAGIAMRGSAVCRIVTAVTQTAGSSTAVSALSFRYYNYNP